MCAWFGLVPLLVALDKKGPGRAWLLSYATGLIFFNGIFYWILNVAGYHWLDHVLTDVAYLPQYVSLWGLGLVWIRRRTGLPTVIVAPPLWVLLEYLRTHLLFLSLPWMFLGHSQYLYPALIQVSSLTGVYGLSFLIVLVNVALAETLLSVCPGVLTPSIAAPQRRFPLMTLGVAGGLVIITGLYGIAVLSTGLSGERLLVAVIQGNIPQKHKWDKAYRRMILERYAALTRQAVPGAPALIIWPETAVPGDVQHHLELRDAIAKLAVETKTSMLVGSAEFAKFTNNKFTNKKLQKKYYNSMVLFSPEGNMVGAYRKMSLVPFAEYEPLRGVVKWPKALVASRGNMLPGEHYTLFSVAEVPFGTTICWENLFPDLFRTFVKRGARFMVNATNEAWFDVTAAPYQLLAMSTFRAAENRVAIARAANTGISAFIDPFGRITERVSGPEQQDLFVQGMLVSALPLAQQTTFYTQFGDVFALLHVIVCAFLLVYATLPGSIRQRFVSRV